MESLPINPDSAQPEPQRPDSDWPPVERWVYRPPEGGPAVLHEEVYDQKQKKGETVRGGFVIIDKPPGLLAVPGIGPEKVDCARSRVLERYPFATGPMSVHRLDVATSGVMVLALDAATHRNFSLQFERRKVSKRYVALIGGHLGPGSGQIRTPMRKDMDRSPTQLVDFGQGKPCCTEWRVLARETLHGEPVTRVELTPHTGRTHQLRVHCADPKPDAVRVVGTPGSEFASGLARGLGAPILGDEMYSGTDPGAACERLMLHAWTLTFNHPVTGKMMSVKAEAGF